MAITTVTANDVVDYVSSKQTKGADIQTGDQLVAAAEKLAGTSKEPTPGNPVIETGVETSADAPPEPQANTETPKKGPKKDVQERIDELTRLRKEAEEFAEDEYNARLRAERRIGELEAQLTAPKPVEQPKAEAIKEPNPSDYQDIAQFAKALTEYNRKLTEQQIAEAREEERQRVAAERQNELMRQRVEVAKSQFEDFDDVITAADRVKVVVPPHVQAAILESDYGPHIAYHLAKNPDDQKRIFALPAAKALLELGKIETSFEKSGSAPVKAEAKPSPTIETTRAPAPVSSIKAEAGTVQSDLSKPMPFHEYARQRREQMRRRRA